MPHGFDLKDAAPTQASQPGAIPSLDGIRALAVMLVFFSHGGHGQLVPGGLGVTIFFVLSGFLITTLLRREFAASGGIHLRAFYLRRIVRLMPPLFVVVALAGALAWLGVIDGGFSLSGLLSVLFYFGNYHVIATDFGGIPAGLGVIWSLAVEEHYYLLYPPLAWWLLRDRRPWLAAVLLSVLCLGFLGWRCLLFLGGASEAHLSMATDARADAILFGCVMAFLRDPARLTTPSMAPRRALALAVACVALLFATLLYRDEFFRNTLRYSLQCLAIAPLIHLAVSHAGSRAARWLNSMPMVYIGTVSYTIYLSHQVIYYGVLRNAPELAAPLAFALTAALTLLVAEAMRRWVESPCIDLRRRLRGQSTRRSRRSDLVSGTAS